MEIKDIISIVTVMIGGLSLFFTIREYIRRGNKERADFFLLLRDRFKKNEKFMKIQSLVENDNNAELETIPTQDLNDIIGFFEEIYLFSNSDFMSKDVLFYMMGQYATDCYNNPTIKKKLELDKEFYWKQFIAFCHEYEGWKKSNPAFEFKV